MTKKDSMLALANKKSNNLKSNDDDLTTLKSLKEQVNEIVNEVTS